MELKDLDDVQLLALCAWAEARGEPREGQIAVMHVVMNRVQHPTWWGNSIKTVILKRYQFSWTIQSDPNFAKSIAAAKLMVSDLYYQDLKSMAKGVIDGTIPDPVKGATHYYAKYIKEPKWVKGMTPCGEIGAHRFFRVQGVPND